MPKKNEENRNFHEGTIIRKYIVSVVCNPNNMCFHWKGPSLEGEAPEIEDGQVNGTGSPWLGFKSTQLTTFSHCGPLL